jgi:hypothetical protein
VFSGDRVSPAADAGHGCNRTFAPGHVLARTFLDNTIISVALGSIQTDLHAGVIALQWVVSAYALTFASAMLAAHEGRDLFINAARLPRLWPRRPGGPQADGLTAAVTAGASSVFHDAERDEPGGLPGQPRPCLQFGAATRGTSRYHPVTKDPAPPASTPGSLLS